MSQPLKLLCAPAAAAHKILITAKFCNLQLENLGRVNETKVLLELEDGKTIEYTNAILKYLARVKSSSLYGDSNHEAVEVDSWLDWTSSEIDVCGNKAKIEDMVKEVLEPYLKPRTFLVGHRVTLADISLAISLFHNAQNFVCASSSKVKYSATLRWYNSCLHQCPFQSVLFSKSEEQAIIQPKQRSIPTPTNSSSVSAVQKPLVKEYSSHVGGRTRLARIVESADGGESLIGQRLRICGWIKTMRVQANLIFVELNDGSTVKNIQIVVDHDCEGFGQLKSKCSTGASLKCEGKLIASPAAGQKVELQLGSGSGDKVTVLGDVDASQYPLAKKFHNPEFLRSVAHLRPRSNLIGCVARVRSALAMATHEFFQQRGFLYVHTPLITAADCEGAGEMFQVTTLLGDDKSNLKKTKDGKIDYTEDFFGKAAYLTVSGQLSVENYCVGLGDVYTFGPTFRAENSKTSRHLAEFWMIEPELAFADISDNMQCAEDYLKFCVQYCLNNTFSDLQFFDEKIENGLIKRLQALLSQPFKKLSYTDGVEILIKEAKEGKVKFEVPVEWGIDLGSEHERYLTEKVFKKPVILYNYPKDIKAFYMRLNDDEKTCAAMDVLVPQIGEVIGGSQREERLDVLDRRIEEMGLKKEDYWWYRDLRKFGTVPHCGFGLGFERLIMLTTGIENIRDVIPYPRYPGHAEF